MKTRLTTLIQLGAIAALVGACTPEQPSSKLSELPAPPEPVASSPSPVPTVPGDPFTKGVDKAASATSLAQSAQTTDDWRLVVTQWQRAIEFMKAVSPTSSNHAAAQKLLATYQQNLARAQQQAKRGGPLQAPIASKADEGGIPLIAGAQPSDRPDASKEAVATVSALLQQQLEYFGKQKRYANTLAELGSSTLAETPSYVYTTSVTKSKQALATASARQDGLPSYTGTTLAVKDDQNNDSTVTAICFTNQPSRTPPPAPQLVGKEIRCPANTTKL